MFKHLNLIPQASLFLAATLFGSLTSARADQIALNPTSVIGGSGSFTGSYVNTQFAAGNVFDNQSATTIPEGDQSNGDANGGYWLGKEADAQESFVVDLGQTYKIDSFDIFNTHNAFYNDRGTVSFEIFGSNSLTPYDTSETGAGGFNLANEVSLSSGSLNLQTSANDPLQAQTFNSSTTNAYRYIRFQTYSSAPPVGNFSGVGINELKVFGTTAMPTPEPQTWAMMAIGLGMMALVVSRRKALS